MRIKSLFFSFLVLSILLGCSKAEQKKAEKPSPKGTHKVTVLEFQNVPSYTYMKVSENDKEYWIAAPTTKVEKGEVLFFKQAMEMKNFESTTLKKTFKSILFVQDISKTLIPEKSSAQTGKQITPIAAHSNNKGAAKVPTAKIKKSKAELTIAKLYKTKDKLNGKKVKFKGKVVKFSPNIMGKNWAHLEDGTKMGSNIDITVTLIGIVSVGQIVTVEGKVKTNVDYGYGYSYPVMIQDAKVIKKK